MGVHNLKFAASESIVVKSGARDSAHNVAEPGDLPLVPEILLDRIFKHLNADEKAFALLNRLVPIAWLPHATLYADATATGAGQHQHPQLQVVARILPQHFNRAVHRNWRKGLIRRAAMGLAVRAPALSARSGLPGAWHLLGLVALAALASLAIPLAPLANLTGFICSTFFLGIIWLRLLALSENDAPHSDPPEHDDDKLPTYSVLVPLFRETRVLPQLMAALQWIDYPQHKLDIKLILEETDTTMLRAVRKLRLPAHIEALIVPAGNPQTKPRALNYALPFARGELLTIFDAEDVPKPMQLRKAARRFAQGPGHLACLQAELAFYNSNENWLTRQFTIEYAVLFRLLLPSLADAHWPLPLGGTSNHFRTHVLRAVDGWDPFNVTEDADLGFRLARLGYAAQTLASCTFEEASSTPRNWFKQRTRWLKGFLITWLVHMRRPRQALRELGFAGFCVMQASLLGVVASALLYPVFLAAFIWKSCGVGFAVSGWQMLLDAYFFGLIPVSWILMLLAGRKALHSKGFFGWGIELASMPVYWLLISAAGYAAVWEFLVAPFQWNKTQHGLSRLMQSEGRGSDATSRSSAASR